jgi:hypothetical protein
MDGSFNTANASNCSLKRKLDFEDLRDTKREKIENTFSLEDLRNITLKVDDLVKMFKENFFRELAIGCYVKMEVPKEGISMYKILDVVERGAGSQEQFKLPTGKASRLVIEYTKLAKKTFPLDFVSKNEVDMDDLILLKQKCEKREDPPPTNEYVQRKHSEIEKFRDIVYDRIPNFIKNRITKKVGINLGGKSKVIDSPLASPVFVSMTMKSKYIKYKDTDEECPFARKKTRPQLFVPKRKLQKKE